jgi:hypothetical protein
MDPITAKLMSAAGGAAEAATYVDDVFSTFVYDGTGADQSIVNGIDLSGEGGMVWIKSRDQARDWNAFDTERGVTKRLMQNSTIAEQTEAIGSLSAFNSNGFTVGDRSDVGVNNEGYCSWTFRKAPGFFDVVTYSGNSTSGRTVAHNLGSAPGMIIVKAYSGTSPAQQWWVFHRSLGAQKALRLNSTNAQSDSATFWNDTEPTSTEFTLGNSSGVNGTGNNYVAYLFAHDDQSFGDDSDEAIIKCGSYTGNGSNNGPEVNLGFEAQWVMTKAVTLSRNWIIGDVMRGTPVSSGAQDAAKLSANVADAEILGDEPFVPTPTGFKVRSNSGTINDNNLTYIYIAIRRPHKPPEAGTDVFHANTTGSGTVFTTGFDVDWAITKNRTSGGVSYIGTRLTGNKKWLRANATTAETTSVSAWEFDHSNSFLQEQVGSGITWTFARAPGFFDVVTYSGTGTDQVVNHGLGVTPELMILKARSTTTAWRVFYKDGSTEKNLQLSTTGAAGNIPASHPWSPSSTTFRADQYFSLSQSGQTFIAYAFASLNGISKVGLFSGTGSDVDVDCGFSAGARFVLIKRTDSTGDWYIYDSVRGIVSGNDPYLLLNDTSSEVTNTDYIDPLNSGFTVTSSAPAALNASGGTYLFLAIA